MTTMADDQTPSSPLTLAFVRSVADKLKAEYLPYKQAMETDMLIYGQAFYRIAPDGTFQYVPAREVISEELLA